MQMQFILRVSINEKFGKYLLLTLAHNASLEFLCYKANLLKNVNASLYKNDFLCLL